MDNREKYSERGKAEREALDGLFKELLKENNKVRYSVYHTPDRTKSKYDCLVRQYSKQTGEMLKKMFFEVKIRGAHYDTLLIEKQKLDSMKRLIRDLDKDKLYYINFTPKNTVVFDLLKIESEVGFNFVNDHHNRTTVEKELGKVSKEVAYIDNKLGTTFQYIYQQKESQSQTQKQPEAPKQQPQPKQQEDFDDDLIKDDEAALIKENLNALNEVIEQAPPVQEISPPEPDPNQTLMKFASLETDVTVIRKDENGQILYDSDKEFRRFPLNIQWLCVAQARIKKLLRPGEDRLMMIELMGGEIELGNFLHQRFMMDFGRKFGIKDEDNPYNKSIDINEQD